MKKVNKQEFMEKYGKYFEKAKDLYLYVKERDFKNFKQTYNEIKEFDNETCKMFGVSVKLDDDIKQIRLRNAIERELGCGVIKWIDFRVEKLTDWLYDIGWNNDQQILLMDYSMRVEKGL